MSKSLEDLIDEDYERLDQEVYEMEELGLSNYGDRSYYIRNRDEYEKDKTIADLEAKLAEKDKAIENWQTMYQSVMQSCHNGIEEDKRLREQLKEKEKEIEELNDKLEWKSKWLKIADNMVGQSNQDKISFCIGQLEKVKNYIVTDEKDMFGSNYLMNPDCVLEFIDNQIEELKKEMK